MTSLRIAFAGTPQFALPALQALLKSRHQVVGVLTQPDRPAGRGQQMRASPVKLLALDAQLPLAQPPTLKTPESRAELTQWAAGCSRRGGLWPHPAAASAGAASPRLREHSWFAAAALARRCADSACDSRRRRGNRRHHHAARRGPRYRTHAARARAGRSARRTRPAICTTRCPSSARLRCSMPSTGSQPARSSRARSRRRA